MFSLIPTRVSDVMIDALLASTALPQDTRLGHHEFTPNANTELVNIPPIGHGEMRRHPPKRLRADGDCQKESARADRERSRALQGFELKRRTAHTPSSHSTSPTRREMALETRPQGEHLIDEAVYASRQVSVVRADADPCEPPAIIEFATKSSHLSNKDRHLVRERTRCATNSPPSDAVNQRTRRRPRAITAQAPASAR